MAYLKPQSPIKYKEDYIYPPTTIDQVIMPDGQRLSGVGVYLDRPDETDDTTLEAGINADTLGGVLAADYALKTETIANAENATNFSGYTFDALKAYMLDLAHPIGSYYWSSEATNPNSLFGGTWEQIKDRFILAAGDSYALGTTGGEAKHTLTVNEMPNHKHQLNGHAFSWGSGVESVVHVSNAVAVAGTVDNNRLYTVQGSWNYTVNNGGNKSHNNMPPYLVAYCWRRTA